MGRLGGSHVLNPDFPVPDLHKMNADPKTIYAFVSYHFYTIGRLLYGSDFLIMSRVRHLVSWHAVNEGDLCTSRRSACALRWGSCPASHAAIFIISQVSMFYTALLGRNYSSDFCCWSRSKLVPCTVYNNFVDPEYGSGSTQVKIGSVRGKRCTIEPLRDSTDQKMSPSAFLVWRKKTFFLKTGCLWPTPAPVLIILITRIRCVAKLGLFSVGLEFFVFKSWSQIGPGTWVRPG